MLKDLLYKEVSDLVKNMKIKRQHFEFSGIKYVLIPCSSRDPNGNPNGLPAEWAYPEGSPVIYLWEDIEERIQRPLLFHEIAEVYYILSTNLKRKQAHEKALQLERRFCEEYLTKDEFNEYTKFKKEYGCAEF